MSNEPGRVAALPDRLKQVIAAYGADPARWPAADRMTFGSYRDHTEVRRAAALDRLLGEASMPELSRSAADAAVARIVATATSTPVRRRSLTGSFALTARNRLRDLLEVVGGRREGSISAIATGTALAASLAVGLYIGSTGVTGSLSLLPPFETVQAEDPALDDLLGIDAVYSPEADS